MNTIPVFNKYFRRLSAMLYAIKYPSLLKKSIRDSIQFLYAEGISKKQSLPQKSLDTILNLNKEIKLQNCQVREGNVSFYELITIAMLIANFSPKNIVEIGTFDGNTTLQIALNSPSNALVHTIDLPMFQTSTKLAILQEDVKYITDSLKCSRKYAGTDVQEKIRQHFGDSTDYDFKNFIGNGLIDFCFIDGGHSYECVKSDTENTLKYLASNGTILWHDFSPNCPGIYRYLCDLQKTLPLIHISGTSFALYLGNSN